jgi:signal transduction histidine kinase
MMRLLPQTIRGELTLLVAVLALPLVALIGYGLYDRTRDDLAASEAIARRLAESNADRVSDYVAGLRATLEAVARRPLVRAMDAKRCDPRLADLVDLYPRAGSLIVVDREGVILCSSRPLPRDRVVRIADQELLSAMLADPGFRVSKPVLSRVTGRWIVSAVHPVLGEDGALLGTVAVATDLLQWWPFAPSEALPERTTLTVVTLDGTIIARSVDAEKWIGGKPWEERLLRRIAERKEGVVRAMGADNVERIFGVSQVAALPWFVLVGLPEESVFALARERLAETSALLLLVVGAVGALAWGFVNRLSRPILAIADAVRARAEGRAEAKIPVTGPVEVAHVARELNRLIEAQLRAERELEDRVRERTAQLEAANKELESFSYSVAHDLRAPLRAIDGFSRIVEEDYAGKLDVEGRRLLGVIRDNSQKMGGLIDDLLEYSRLGRKPLSSAEIDMHRLVEEVFGELQASGGRSLKVVLAALPPARGDALLVKQTWANLLGNAIKFSGKREQPVIEVSGYENGAENVYCVKDNGAGFDMKYIDKLFGVFQRLHSAEEFAGTGVGLAIVQRVVSRHGGRVWAEGKVDEGAAFHFSLPKGGPDGQI